jgi:hypothetical protein
MEPVDGIRRLGFNRWYERRLIEAHAWFITGFICLVTIAALMEELSVRGSAARLVAYALLIAAATLVGVYGMVRYQKILLQAERVGEQATCTKCDTYGRFSIFADCMARCRKCGHEWRLID